MHPAHDMIRISSLKTFPENLFENISNLYCDTISPLKNHLLNETDCNVLEDETQLVNENESEENTSIESSNLIYKPPFVQELESNKVTVAESSTEECLKTEVAADCEIETFCTDKSITSKNIILETSTAFQSTEKSIPEQEKETDNLEVAHIESNGDNHEAHVEKLTQTDEFHPNKYEIDEDIDISETKNLDIDENISIKTIGMVEEVEHNQTSLTKEELKSFEANPDENKDEIADSHEPCRSIQEEIESLLAPMTPLPDLESVSSVMKINKGDEIISNISKRESAEKSGEKNDNELLNEKNRFSFPPDKKSKDRENSAIASSSMLVKGSIHSCLEDSLKKLEDTMKSASTKFGEYGETDAHDQCSTNSLTGSSSNKSVERESQVPLNSKQPEITPTVPKRHYNPRIANALDQMMAMGFSDNDGWLTELLVRKHGDIIQVLDILSPVSK